MPNIAAATARLVQVTTPPPPPSTACAHLNTKTLAISGRGGCDDGGGGRDHAPRHFIAAAAVAAAAAAAAAAPFEAAHNLAGLIAALAQLIAIDERFLLFFALADSLRSLQYKFAITRQQSRMTSTRRGRI